jgi:hypothetical protein
MAVLRTVPCGGEKFIEVLDPLLPGSEQFKLQQSRAIDTSGVLRAECAFLQQSRIFVIGQEPSCSCAPTPMTPLSKAATRVKIVNNLGI